MSDILSLFSNHCEKVQPLSKGQYVALCPFHNDNNEVSVSMKMVCIIAKPVG